jgi:hypothetical protein
MFEHYLAALLRLRQAPDLAYTALPGAARPDESSDWDPCPCGRWGVARADRHGCVALVRELFPQLERELDAWEAAYGWLYR